MSDIAVGIKGRRGAFNFGTGQSENRFLESGWGLPEAGFVWSEGQYATIALPGSFRQPVLKLSCWGHVTTEVAFQRVGLFCNGLLVSWFKLGERAIYDFKLRFVESQESLVIALHLPDAHAPAENGPNPDRRELGLALAGIQVEQ